MSVSLSRVVPLSRVCVIAGGGALERVRGPKTAYTDEPLLAAIREVLSASPFVGEGYRKVWTKLRFAGIRTGGPRGPQTHDGTLLPDASDRIWETDLTSTVTTKDGQVGVFFAVDHSTAELVGTHAATPATRHDHGTQYLSDAFQTEIAFLGIESSPSFVRAPEGNGCAERLIRSLKEQLLWVRTFATVEELRLALADWAELYNREWMIERHGYRSPSEAPRAYYARRQDRVEKIAA